MIFAPSTPIRIQAILFTIATPTIITAHIVALYSRLHLLLRPSYSLNNQHRLLLRCVFHMIILTSVRFTAPLTINYFLCIIDIQRFGKPVYIIERTAFTGFSIRELFICGIYIVEGLKQPHPIIQAKGGKGRRVMMHLILGQTFIIIVDMFFLVMLYVGPEALHFAPHVETSFFAMLFSLKLKLEFVILNRLVFLLESPVQRLGTSILGAGGGLVNSTTMTATSTTVAESYKGLKLATDRAERPSSIV
ncbi:hypothetical protein BJX70DRAFT_399391 [Aspergillus crustosus]